MSTESKPFGQKVALVLGIALLPQCGERAGGDDESQCIPGELECACNGGQCLEGLSCVNAICVATDESETGTEVGSDSSTSEEETSQDVSTGTEAGTETETGSEAETESNPCVDPETFCDGECVDLSIDDNNCGECGNTCKVELETGGCIEGVCAPVWSECIDAVNLVPCSDICQSEGLAECVTAECGRFQSSVGWYTSSPDCEVGDVSVTDSDACEILPSVESDFYYRCCCAQQ